MCYSGSCVYEDYDGECRKPSGAACPDGESERAYSRADDPDHARDCWLERQEREALND